MRVTAKGQVTMPKELRDTLGTGAGSEVQFEQAADAILTRKAADESARGRRSRDYFPAVRLIAPEVR